MMKRIGSLASAVLALLSSTAAIGQVAAPEPKTTFPALKDFPVKWPAQPEAPAKAPNVLVIMTDDEGFGASSTFGGVIPTPNFTRLADQGLRYNNFNTTGMCSPTRASLLTGRYQHNVEMGGLSDVASGYDGYTSIIPKSTATIAEILKERGYSTAMFGKGHITPPWELTAVGPFDRWPTGMGFEYFYGFLQGDTNQWAPTLVENTRYIQPPANDPTYILDKDLADRSIKWLREQHEIAPDKPFFIYYATGSTHSPHHAPAEWIAKFRGQFDGGWDKLREHIFARQKAAGIIPKDTKLPPRPAELPAWNSLSSDEKRVAARFMEAYAGQLAFADAQIGRVLAALDASGQAENTLVILIQGDNGASAEGSPSGNFYEQTLNFHLKEDIAYDLKHIDEIGGPLADNMYPAGWAWAMNTPFQWFKQNASHFGGIRNGMVLRWPGHIKDRGGLRNQFSHVSDIVPTILEATGVAAPKVINGETQKPIDGISLGYTLGDPTAAARRTTQYFEIMENASIYHDGWVAATKPTYMPWDLFSATRPNVDFNDRKWELYNVAKDFSEARDLAAAEPKKLREMQQLFLAEGLKNHVFPVHTLAAGTAGRPGFATRKEYVFGPDTSNLYVAAAPPISNRSFEIEADAVLPDGGGDGVIVAQGGRYSGYSLYLKRGILSFTYNAVPPRVYTVRSSAALTPGTHKISVHFIYDGGGVAAGGTLAMDVDGKEVARGRIPNTVPRIWFTEGLDVGKDQLTPVSEDYATPATFTGTIQSVRFHLP